MMIIHENANLDENINYINNSLIFPRSILSIHKTMTRLSFVYKE